MRVVVIGAGIGGLVTAAALQADGHEVQVFEQRADAGAVGAGLTLFGNAFRSLDRVGLRDAVREVSSAEIGSMTAGLRLPSGRWLVRRPVSAGRDVRALHRADLHAALVARLQPGTLRLGASAVVSPDGAPVVEVDGQRHTADLVVAADGIRSAARQRWGLDRGLRYAGYTAWRGVADLPGAREAGETWGRGRRFGVVPLGGRRVYWFATMSGPAGREVEGDREMLRAAFGGWHAPLGELLEATPPDGVLRHDIHDLAKLPPTFVHGRGVLVGDAAHAMTPDLGQGAGQAIEDAAVLMTLLRKSPSPESLTSALASYDRTRRRRSRVLWRASRMAGRASYLLARRRDGRSS